MAVGLTHNRIRPPLRMMHHAMIAKASKKRKMKKRRTRAWRQPKVMTIVKPQMVPTDP